MFTPRNIIHAYFPTMQKNKYLISLYRNKDFYIVAAFTTSQNRRGYIFDANKRIGIKSDGISDFAFSKKTTIAFDYCFVENYQWALSEKMKDAQVIASLNLDEYKNLIYAMYCSDDVKSEYKKYFEKILEEIS